jgi:hypothetical protein
LTVVSSDHRVQRAARRRRATAVDSEVWFDGLGRKRLPRKKANRDVPAKPIGKLTDADIKMWLEAFSGEPDDEARSERREDGGAVDADVIDNPFPPGYADDLLNEDE